MKNMSSSAQANFSRAGNLAISQNTNKGPLLQLTLVFKSLSPLLPGTSGRFYAGSSLECVVSIHNIL